MAFWLVEYDSYTMVSKRRLIAVYRYVFSGLQQMVVLPEFEKGTTIVYEGEVLANSYRRCNL